MMRYLIGPEIFWLMMYAAAAWLDKANRPPTQAMDNFIERLWFWTPAASLLVFGLWWLPGVEQNWLLLRVWISGLVGGHCVLERSLSAYSKQGPGIGMGYLVGLMLEVVVLIIGSIIIFFNF